MPPRPASEAVRAAGGEALAVTADVSDEAQVAELVGRTVAEFGRLDVLHNNAAALGEAHRRDRYRSTWPSTSGTWRWPSTPAA